MVMIHVAQSVFLDEKELTFDFIRASGPGGQNVNKVATAAQLRFDVRNSPSLPVNVKERLVKLAGARMTQDGVLVIEAKRYRTQERNRADAELRLAALIQKALVKPKKRRPTKPSATVKAKRLDSKKRRAAVKRFRQVKPDSDE